MGFGALSWGFQVSGFRFQISDFRFQDADFRSQVSGFGVRVHSIGSRESQFLESGSFSSDCKGKGHVIPEYPKSQINQSLLSGRGTSRFGPWGLGLGFGVWDAGSRVWGLGFLEAGLGVGAWGLEFGVWSLMPQVQHLGFRV